ncbi:MAG: MarR family winged helix-turn-helix transcriptional regulator [Fidelibacterota bacterium]
MKPTPINFGHFVAMSARLMRNSINHWFREQGYDLTIDHLMIMKILCHSDGISQQGIADFFSKDKGTITRMINTMEGKNLVVRIPDRSDRRSKLIYLTPYGKNLQQEMFQAVLDFNESLISDIPKDDLERCVGVLGKIIDKLCNDDVACATKIESISNP